MSWSQIIEGVLRLPHQQNLLVPKRSIVHPQAVGIPYSCGAYRKTVPDGRAIDIKEDEGYWYIHWDWHNPNTHLIEHGCDDAPGELLLVTTLGMGAIRALNSPEGEKEKAALRGCAEGFGLGLLVLLLRESARKN